MPVIPMGLQTHDFGPGWATVIRIGGYQCGGARTEAHKLQMGIPPDWNWVDTNDTTWTETTTMLPAIALLFDQADDGAGGANVVGFAR